MRTRVPHSCRATTAPGMARLRGASLGDPPFYVAGTARPRRPASTVYTNLDPSASRVGQGGTPGDGRTAEKRRGGNAASAGSNDAQSRGRSARCIAGHKLAPPRRREHSDRSPALAFRIGAATRLATGDPAARFDAGSRSAIAFDNRQYDRTAHRPGRPGPADVRAYRDNVRETPDLGAMHRAPIRPDGVRVPNEMPRAERVTTGPGCPVHTCRARRDHPEAARPAMPDQSSVRLRCRTARARRRSSIRSAALRAPPAPALREYRVESGQRPGRGSSKWRRFAAASRTLAWRTAVRGSGDAAWEGIVTRVARGTQCRCHRPDAEVQPPQANAVRRSARRRSSALWAH